MELNLRAFINLAGILQGVFLLFTLRKYLWQHFSAICLAALLAINTYFLLIDLIIAASWVNRFPHLVGTWFPLVMLLGPLLWVYIKSIYQSTVFSWQTLFIHCVPAILYALMLIPFFAQSGTEKAKYFDTLYPWYYEIFEVLRKVHLLLYVYLSYRVVNNSQKANGAKTNNAQIKWTRGLLIAYFIIALLALGVYLLAVYFKIYWVAWGDMFVSLALVSIVYLLAYLGIRSDFQQVIHQARNNSKTTQKYASSSLGLARKKAYIEKLQTHIETQQLYLIPTLTLQQLAQSLQIPTAHLSEALNQELQLTFSQFINQYRVAAVKQKIQDPKEGYKTLYALALESGFNSKASFNRFFKQFTGVTPSEYKKQMFK